jgi:hypothetical protein
VLTLNLNIFPPDILKLTDKQGLHATKSHLTSFHQVKGHITDTYIPMSQCDPFSQISCSHVISFYSHPIVASFHNETSTRSLSRVSLHHRPPIPYLRLLSPPPPPGHRATHLPCVVRRGAPLPISSLDTAAPPFPLPPYFPSSPEMPVPSPPFHSTFSAPVQRTHSLSLLLLLGRMASGEGRVGPHPVPADSSIAGGDMPRIRLPPLGAPAQLLPLQSLTPLHPHRRRQVIDFLCLISSFQPCISL